MNFLENFLAALGGAVGIVLILLVLAKSLFQKWIETIIDGASAKSLEKYSNLLNRRTTAYEMLLKKEFSFYDNAEKLLSGLIVDIMDFSFDLGISDDCPDKCNYTEAKETAIRILDFIPEFKRETLLAHTFIPDEIDAVSTNLLHELQKSMHLLYDGCKLLSENNLDEATKERIKANEDKTLMNCALVNLRIKTRLEDLSKE